MTNEPCPTCGNYSNGVKQKCDCQPTPDEGEPDVYVEPMIGFDRDGYRVVMWGVCIGVKPKKKYADELAGKLKRAIRKRRKELNHARNG